MQYPTDTVFRPVGSFVLVEPPEPKEMSDGGIALIPEKTDRPEEGTVLAVGPGRVMANGEREPMQVEEGDYVWFWVARPQRACVTVGDRNLYFVEQKNIEARRPAEDWKT